MYEEFPSNVILEEALLSKFLVYICTSQSFVFYMKNVEKETDFTALDVEKERKTLFLFLFPAFSFS